MYNSSRNHRPSESNENSVFGNTPLPDILAGPIVRRCEYKKNIGTTTVNIWLATSKNYDNVFAEILNTTGGGNIISSVSSWKSKCDYIHVSDNFWVWMLEIEFETSVSELQSGGFSGDLRYVIKKGANNNTIGNLYETTTNTNPFVADSSTIKFEELRLPPYFEAASETSFAYNIHFIKNESQSPNSDNNFKMLKDLINDMQEIALPGWNLPFFSVQTRNQKLRCLFGSCRKAHGVGKDASKGMELKLIEQLNNDNKDFPNALFFTGDQIYADDVDSKLLDSFISPLLKKLNIHEPLISPGLHGGSKKSFPTKLGYDRKSYIELSGFTSTASINHLIYFGEFAAMYLIMWNSNLWNLNPKLESILEDNNYLNDAFQGTKSIRRVLANVPTYMIIDDHDVTDDFYFDESWKTEVLNSGSGMRLISHALANYWLFQAWGNTFEGIPTDFAEKITGYTLGNEAWVTEYDKIFIKYNKWSFIAPTNPPAVFLNTRTQRKSTKEATKENIETNSGPILINNDEYKRLVELIENDSYFLYDKKPVIIVSPSPILTLTSIETGITYKYKNTPLEGDIETFNSNKYTFFQFGKFIREYINPSHLIIISGDVHYATIGYGWLSGYNLGSEGIYISQFTSSALKNEPTGIEFRLLKIADTQAGYRKNTTYYYEKVGKEIIAWGRWDPTTVTSGKYEFKLKYDFISTNKYIDIVHHRAFSESNFGYFEKATTTTTISATISDASNEAFILFEGDTKKWPI